MDWIVKFHSMETMTFNDNNDIPVMIVASLILLRITDIFKVDPHNSKQFQTIPNNRVCRKV